MISPEQATEALANAQQLFGLTEIEQALDRLARQIGERLAGSNPLVLCVLNGALIPMGHLLTRLDFPLRQDYIHASRYQGATRGTELEWIGRPDTSLLAGERVLVVDDILDEGVTLAEIVRYCRSAGAKEVLSVVLVEKRHDRNNGFRADFVGLQVPDRYVFGFGMDYKDYWRNLPGIYAI